MTPITLKEATEIAQVIRERVYFSDVEVKLSERLFLVESYGVNFKFEGMSFTFESRVYSHEDGYQLTRKGSDGLDQVLAFGETIEKLLHKICSKNVLRTTLDYYMDEICLYKPEPIEEIDESLFDDDLFADLDLDDYDTITSGTAENDSSPSNEEVFFDEEFEKQLEEFNKEFKMVTEDNEPAEKARIESSDQTFNYTLEIATKKENGEFFVRKVRPMTIRGKLYKEFNGKQIPLRKNRLLECSLSVDGNIPEGYELKVILSKIK